MARRALVLGSQIDGLRGVGNDTQRIAAMLDARGFTVDLRTGAAATRAGMLAGYDQLIAATGVDDAAVVYYCGHGYYASASEDGRVWQCIAPTDLRDGTATDWRGITGWELSIKQAQLTAKTRNVTVILDCCHSAQLSRGDGVDRATPRALPHPTRVGFAEHLAALRAAYGAAFDAVDPIGNAHAVRVVACGQSEPAFESIDAAGEHHGVFTKVLVEVLTEVGNAPVSWAQIIGSIRASVLRDFPRQRPDIEGPVRRQPFSLIEHEDAPGVAVTAKGPQIRLSAGRLTGATVRDLYNVLPAKASIGDGAGPIAQLEIIEVHSTTAVAHRTSGSEPIPHDVIAVPIRRHAQKWPVAIHAPEPARATVEAAVRASATLRIAQPGDSYALATVCVDNATITIEDAGGSLWRPARYPSELERVVGRLANLGVAQGIRELEGEHGVPASDLVIQLGRVSAGRAYPLPDHGSVFGLCDRYYVQIENRGERPLFAHLLNISSRGKITLLSHFARGGVVLDRHRSSVMFGQRADGVLVGVGLRWPEGLPAEATPRLTELVVIVTRTITDLSGLETRDLSVRSRGNRLHQLLAQLCDGKYRDASDGTVDDHASARARDGFLVKRLSILLSPGERASEDHAQAFD